MKFFSNGLRIALGSMLMLLAACDDARQSSVTFRLDDVWSFARGAMNSRPLPVDIRGLPYGGDGAALHDAVIGAMTKAITWSANPRFTADSASAGRSTLRVVVTLNGGGGFSGRDQCLGKAEGNFTTVGSGRSPLSATEKTCWPTSMVMWAGAPVWTTPGSRALFVK